MCFFSFLRSLPGNCCLTYPHSTHSHFSESWPRPPWTRHFPFGVPAHEQMGPSRATFFLQLDREVCSWAGFLSGRTVLLGHILFRALWKGELCEGSPCRGWGRGVSWWACSGRFIRERDVFLSSVMYPCLWSKEWWGRESSRSDSRALTWSWWGDLSLQLSSAPGDSAAGWPNTWGTGQGQFSSELAMEQWSNFIFLLLVLTFWITFTSLSKGKIQGSEHSEHFLVIQCVCHVSRFMLGGI